MTTYYFDKENNFLYKHEHLHGLAFDDAVELVEKNLQINPYTYKAIVTSKTKGKCEITKKMEINKKFIK